MLSRKKLFLGLVFFLFPWIVFGQGQLVVRYPAVLSNLVLTNYQPFLSSLSGIETGLEGLGNSEQLLLQSLIRPRSSKIFNNFILGTLPPPVLQTLIDFASKTPGSRRGNFGHHQIPLSFISKFPFQAVTTENALTLLNILSGIESLLLESLVVEDSALPGLNFFIQKAGTFGVKLQTKGYRLLNSPEALSQETNELALAVYLTRKIENVRKLLSIFEKFQIRWNYLVDSQMKQLLYDLIVNGKGAPAKIHGKNQGFVLVLFSQGISRGYSEGIFQDLWDNCPRTVNFEFVEVQAHTSWADHVSSIMSQNWGFYRHLPFEVLQGGPWEENLPWLEKLNQGLKKVDKHMVFFVRGSHSFVFPDLARLSNLRFVWLVDQPWSVENIAKARKLSSIGHPVYLVEDVLMK